MKQIDILEGLGLSVLGIAVVFFGLICLMVVIMIMVRIMNAKKKEVPAAEPAPVQETRSAPVYAPGSAGDIKLYNVDPRTAAILMAITADKLQKPLNELRFISVKCVDEE